MKSPYQPGDILALCGGGIAYGCHLFVAEIPAVRHGDHWRMGNQFGRQWGTDYQNGLTLRHATVADAERLVRIHAQEVEHCQAELHRMRKLAGKIKHDGYGVQHTEPGLTPD